MLHTYKCFNIILYSHSITYNNHSTYSCTLQLWDWDIELDTNPQALDVQLIIFYSVTTRVEMLQSAQQCQNWPWIGQTTTSHITSPGLSPSQPKPSPSPLSGPGSALWQAQAHQSPAQARAFEPSPAQHITIYRTLLWVTKTRNLTAPKNSSSGQSWSACIPPGSNIRVMTKRFD